MYYRISEWIDSVMKNGMPKEVISVCFNLYDDIDNTWSLEMVGCSSFDEDDSDWACDEVTDFGTRNNPLRWIQDSDWSEIQLMISDMVSRYLKEGTYKKLFNNLDGVAVGFVDGDLELLKRNSK